MSTTPIPADHGFVAQPAVAKPFRFIKPTLPPLEDVLEYYAAGYNDGQITNGRLVARFEDAAAERLGVRHCVAVSSCTSGLMITLRALSLTGEVIIPSFTFFATGHAVLWNGLNPVFADCEPERWTLDPVKCAARVTSKTSAILGVHLYGNPCDIEGLSDLATRLNLKLIFDAAHGFGSKYRGLPIGQFGDAEVFSFSPTKLLVAGEGGLIATNDATLARRAKLARNYGDSGSYDPELRGLNARMPEFNAALALSGLPLVARKVQAHNEIARRYEAAIAGVDGIHFQRIDQGNTHSFKDFTIYIDPAVCGFTREELAATLAAENIETKKYFYPPLHRQKLYAPLHDGQDDLAVTDRIANGILSLPIYESLDEEIPVRIGDAIQRLAHRRSHGATNGIA